MLVLFYSHLFTFLYSQMNKLETNPFMYIFIMYFHINVTFQFLCDKQNYGQIVEYASVI